MICGFNDNGDIRVTSLRKRGGRWVHKQRTRTRRARIYIDACWDAWDEGAPVR